MTLRAQKVTAEQARNTLGPLCNRQPDNSNFAGWLALANAMIGDKETALKEAKRAIRFLPSAKDAVDGPGLEENMALIQTLFGQNDRAISTLRRLLQTPSQSQLYGPMPLTWPFSGLIRFGTPCVLIQLFVNFATKSSYRTNALTQ